MVKTIATYNSFKYRMVWRVTQRSLCGQIISSECTNKSILASEQDALHKDYIVGAYPVDMTKVQNMSIDLMPVEYFIGDKNELPNR